MDKGLLRMLFPLLLVAAVLAFALSMTPSASGHAHASAEPKPTLSIHARSNAHPAANTPTPTATPMGGDKSQPGSTDGLVVMSFAIVFIIVLPILLQRSLWRK